MAVVVGTIDSVSGFNLPSGPSLHSTISADEHETECCVVHVTWLSGTYASGDDANFSPATAIQTAKRDGKTVTILQACFMSAGDENGAVVGADACAVSAGVITAGLTQEDLATERADGAMSATWNRPMAFCVTYHQPA